MDMIRIHQSEPAGIPTSDKFLPGIYEDFLLYTVE